jgi:Fic family protein
LAELDREKLHLVLEVPPLVGGEYAPWDKVRHLSPPPALSLEEWWLGIKLARNQLLKPIPLVDTGGRAFQFGTPDSVLRLTHEIDQLASGRIQISEEVTNPSTRDRYIVSSLIEESITSSQLEGASTTSEVAKNMLRTGRRPIDRSEQMILNNFHAMRFVRQHAHEKLTPQFVFDLHRSVTADTLDDPLKAGCFRGDEDDIQVEDEIGTLLHRPPRATELQERMERMCDFANDRPDDWFLHPVLRAIMLHFWMGYDHPFVDGNGRTARALFYWSMLSQGYWLAEYISISRVLHKAHAQYSRSFLFTEIDDNDLTYFISYHLSVIRRAISDLQQYLERKITEVRETESLLRSTARFNHRQLALLSHALRRPETRFTIESHRRSHAVVYDTARTDLLELSDRGLLAKRKRGRTYEFVTPNDLAKRLADLDGGP